MKLIQEWLFRRPEMNCQNKLTQIIQPSLGVRAYPSKQIVPSFYLFMKKALLITTLSALATLIAMSQASALTFSLNFEFSDGQAPGGPPPWLTATFTDAGAGHVTLTLAASGLIGSENVAGWYFNVSDAFVGNLTFLDPAPVGQFDLPTIQQGLNAFQADGDGRYDILLSFTPGGIPSQVFGAGESLSYSISAPGLTAADFNHLSEPAGGHGPFFTAAHIQNTTGPGSGGSGWIAPIPEPSITSLAITGGLLTALFLRFGSRKASSSDK